MPTLYERIGGADTVDQIVDAFYTKLLLHEHTASLVDAADMEAHTQAIKLLLGQKLGGTEVYTGPDPKALYTELAGQGLTAEVVDAIQGLLVATASEIGLESPEVDEIAQHIDAFREEIGAG